MLHDGGFLFGRKVPAKGELFNQVGLKIDLPALSLLCGKPPIIRWDTFLPSFGMKASNVTALASMPTAPAATDSKLRLIGKIKLQAMK